MCFCFILIFMIFFFLAFEIDNRKQLGNPGSESAPASNKK